MYHVISYMTIVFVLSYGALSSAQLEPEAALDAHEAKSICHEQAENLCINEGLVEGTERFYQCTKSTFLHNNCHNISPENR